MTLRNPEVYQKWRSSIPFTDEQIAECYDKAAIDAANLGWEDSAKRRREIAEKARQGFITLRMISNILPDLVTICSYTDSNGITCNKKALYRHGFWGRCRAHRFNVPTQEQMRIALNEAHHTYRSHQKDARDRLLRKQQAHYLARGHKSGRSKV
jgi:hypothetical protein